VRSDPLFLKRPWRVNDKCRKLTFVGTALNVPGKQENKNKYVLTKEYRDHSQIKTDVNTCI
jgi:hypothetical protein